MTKHIGKLERVPLREIWPNEAFDFTAWLSENLDILGEALGISLTLVQREAAVGPFSIDILAEDSNGNQVIVENQIGRTDHDHLGKLITYLSNLDAKAAIWISSNPRPEHVKSITWLNETTPADVAFYLVRVEAYRIGESPPAPMFSIVAGPSAEIKQIGTQKKELAERHLLRMEFWKQLLERAKGRPHPHARRVSPGKEHWLGAGAGKSGLTYSYVVRMDNASVELYIDRGNAEENKRIFDKLYEHKEEIEAIFGAPLEWQRMDERRSSRVRYTLNIGGLRDREKWPEMQEAMIDAMIRLSKALGPKIKRLRI